MNANKNCVDMNECLHASENNCDDVAICSNTLGSYSCTCNSGYVGDGVICEDVNECSDGIHSCDTNAKCLNTDGSYQCECLNGFVGDGSFCDDVNECAADSANDCVEHSFCTNTYGSYICACKPGYGVAVKRRQKNLTTGQFCADIDECENNPCDTYPNCKNTDGSFTCSCDTGFIGDGFTCKDFNECDQL